MIPSNRLGQGHLCPLDFESPRCFISKIWAKPKKISLKQKDKPINPQHIPGKILKNLPVSLTETPSPAEVAIEEPIKKKIYRIYQKAIRITFLLLIFLLQLHCMVRHICSVCRRCVVCIDKQSFFSPLETSLSSTLPVLGLQWPFKSGASQRRAARILQSIVPGCCQYLDQSTYQ